MAQAPSKIKHLTEAQKRLARIDVLLLDNDPKIIDLLKNVMVTLGFKSLHTARDGFEGIKLIKQVPLDLIITDWDLQPVRDYPDDFPPNAVVVSEWGEFTPNNGASFVKCLRHSSYSPNPFVPVIMLTGPTLMNNIRYARDAGVNEILIKPIVAQDLCERIIEIVNHPRPYVTSQHYRGPCRRRKQVPLEGKPDRRKLDIRVVKFEARA